MMKTTPATMPTMAAAAPSLLCLRRGSAYCGATYVDCDGGGGGATAVSTGPVAGSDEEVGVSLISTIIQTVSMRSSCITYETAVNMNRFIASCGRLSTAFHGRPD